jgi:HTH-type transcriptional regulator/antitoxin HipB
MSANTINVLPPSLVVFTAPHLGQLLKSTRKRHKLTQKYVASRLGLSQNRVSYLELHADELSVQQLLGWCAVLDLELSIAERPHPVTLPDLEW